MSAASPSKKVPEKPTRVTEAAVFAACDELVMAGEPPTFENVRRITRVGSPNTIYAHIRSYQKVLPERIAARTGGAQVPDLPESIAGQFAAIWKEATSAARTAAAEAVAKRQAELDGRAAALDQTARALERREAELGQRLEEMTKRLALANEQLKEADSRARDADTARLAAATELERARYRITDLEKEGRALVRTLEESEQRHLATLAERDRAHACAIAELREAHTAERAERDTAATRERAAYEARLGDAQAREATLADALATTRELLRKSETAVIDWRRHVEDRDAHLGALESELAVQKGLLATRTQELAEVRRQLEADARLQQRIRDLEAESVTRGAKLEQTLVALTRQLAAQQEGSKKR